MLLHSDLIYVKRVPGKGRGVFARRPIPRGTIIEHVPVYVLPRSLIEGAAPIMELKRVCFLRTRKTMGVALGYGSLYNHSYRPNARYEDGDDATMFFRALRNIGEGEEITVNYNGVPNDRGSVGFEVVENNHAKHSATTLPATSVRRKSRPSKR